MMIKLKFNPKQLSIGIYFVASLLLSACDPAIVGVGPTINNVHPETLQLIGEKGQLIIYRATSIDYPVNSSEVFVNDRQIGDGEESARCSNSSFFLINTPPGTYKISMMPFLSTEIDVVVEKNNRYFIRCTLVGGYFPKIDLELVTSDIGKEEVLNNDAMIFTGIYEIK